VLNRKLLILLFLFLATSNIEAQEESGHPLLSDDWLFRFGLASMDANVKVGLANEDIGTIPVINLNDLGVDNKFTSGWAYVVWQAPKKWSWGFNYFRSEVDGERVTSSDIEFGDLDIPAGSGVKSKFVTNFYVLNGYYDFYQSPTSAAGVGLGIYGLDLKMDLQAFVGDEAGAESQSASVLAPLPTLSLYYKHAFNDKWAIWANAGYFSANIDNYDGDIVTASISVDYWFNENWGLGAGYNYVDIDLTVDKPVFDQLYNVEWNAAFVYLTAGF